MEFLIYSKNHEDDEAAPLRFLPEGARLLCYDPWEKKGAGIAIYAEQGEKITPMSPMPRSDIHWDQELPAPYEPQDFLMTDWTGLFEDAMIDLFEGHPCAKQIELLIYERRSKNRQQHFFLCEDGSLWKQTETEGEGTQMTFFEYVSAAMGRRGSNRHYDIDGTDIGGSWDDADVVTKIEHPTRVQRAELEGFVHTVKVLSPESNDFGFVQEITCIEEKK